MIYLENGNLTFTNMTKEQKEKVLKFVRDRVEGFAVPADQALKQLAAEE